MNIVKDYSEGLLNAGGDLRTRVDGIVQALCAALRAMAEGLEAQRLYDAWRRRGLSHAEAAGRLFR